MIFLRKNLIISILMESIKSSSRGKHQNFVDLA